MPDAARFYAHSTKKEDRSDWETVEEHAAAVAERAEGFASAFGAGKAGRLAGFLHDLGKFDPRFQARLSDDRIRVDHSTAGARWLMDQVGGELAPPARFPDRVTAELLAQCVAGHHAGLPDRRGTDAALDSRVEAFDMTRLAPGWRSLLPLDLAGLFPAGFKFHPNQAFRPFQAAMLGRFLFSALVDADRRATEAFYASHGETARDRDWARLADRLPAFRDAFDRKIAGFGSPDRPLARLRAEILARVREQAFMEPGLFTLSVPTGGGKTLASLGFALDHAAHHNERARAERFRRIIIAIPFTSVTEQVSEAWREVLGEADVLEHHSGFEEDEPPMKADGADSEHSAKSKLRLAMEDWASPVVVTTHVQLFESLFAARTSRARKIHNVANSIVILDEAQALPMGLLGPTVRAIEELARNYGCTVVLCTATQPAFNARHYTGKNADSPLALTLGEARELAPDPDGLHRRLKRASIRRAPAPMTDGDLVEALRSREQDFVIVNSRAHALALYRLAEKADVEGLLHLTTRQHANDRRRVLADIRDRLRSPEQGGGQPCRLIATSLIEAGVDLDFPAGWRAETGLDGVVQAAGRVNRHDRRRLEASVLTVFEPAEAKPPREFEALIPFMREAFLRHPDDVASPEAMTEYFRNVYWLKDRQLDAKGILGKGLMNVAAGNIGADIAFRTIADLYRMIEERTVPVIVLPVCEEEKILNRLAAPKVPSGVIARELQRYTVPTPKAARAQLVAAGHVQLASPGLRADQFPILRTRKHYTREVGLLWEDAGYLANEDMIV